MVGSLVTAAVAWVILSGKDDNYTNDDDNDGNGWWGAKWRLFAAICALSPATAAWTCWQWAPESPRFLIAQGRIKDAEVALENLLTVHGPTSAHEPLPPMVRLEARSSSINMDGEPGSNTAVSASLLPSKSVHETSNAAGESIGIVAGSSLERTQDDNSSSIGSSSTGCAADVMHLLEQWRALVVDRRNRRPFLALCGVWVALSFGYYGLATWITVLFDACGLTNVYASAFLYCAAQLPGNLAVFVLVDRIGRRPLLLASMLSAAASALLFAWVSDPNSSNASNQVASSRVALVVVAAMLFNAACTAAWDVVNVAR